MLPDNIKLALELIGVDHASMSIDEAGDALRQYAEDAEEAGRASEEAAQNSSQSWTEFKSMYSTVLDVLEVGKQIINETVGVTVDYANEVRQLSAISGESAENTSRFLQVLDDYKIGAEDALAATRNLTKNGLTPSTETLAMLSDQYLSLTSAQEKNEFILKNLGRSGLGWVNVLEKGSTAIREQSAAINENLILTEKSLLQAREYELALDEWNDSVLGLKVALGRELLPQLTNFLSIQEDTQRATELAAEEGVNYLYTIGKTRDAYLERARAEREAKFAVSESAQAMQDAAEDAADYAAQLEEVGKANKAIIDGAISITKDREKYAEQQDEILEKIKETRAEGEKLYPWEAEKIDENKQKLEELGEQYFENQEKFREAMEEKWALMAVDKIEMSDGVAGFNEAEYQKASAILQNADVATAAAFEEQQAMTILSQAVADGRIPVEEWGTIFDKVMADGVVHVEEVQAEIDAVPKQNTVTFDIITNGAPPNLDVSTEAATAPKGTHRRSNASGGTYMIPPVWGNEGFPVGTSDTASAGELITITPKSQLGNDSRTNQLLEAIAANSRIDYGELSRALVIAVQQGAK